MSGLLNEDADWAPDEFRLWADPRLVPGRFARRTRPTRPTSSVVAPTPDTRQYPAVPRPVSRRLMLSAIEATNDEATYRVSFVDEHGVRHTVVANVRDVAGKPAVVGYDPDVFSGWDGDAESVRSVAAAVVALAQARDLSPLRTKH